MRRFLGFIFVMAVGAMPGTTHAQQVPAGMDPLANNAAIDIDTVTGTADLNSANAGQPSPQPVVQTADVARTGAMVVPPPAPGGDPMVDGQIPAISADMLALTPEEQQEIAMQEAHSQVFKATLKNTLPLEPAEIQGVIRRYEDTTREVEAPFGGKEPKPEVKIETLSLEPNATPPVVRLAPGHVTSITMLDSTGQPWPVQDVSWGGDFEIQAPEDGGHIIRISPLGGYKTGNLSLRLQDLSTPVTFTLRTQPDIVDYRFDARLPVPGPNATPPVIEQSQFTSVAGSGDMMMVLDGTLPPGAEMLGVSGVDPRTSAYKVGGEVYVRTPYTMLSPAWTQQAASADGLKVYVIPETPVLILSDKGKMLRANVASSTPVVVTTNDNGTNKIVSPGDAAAMTMTGAQSYGQ